MGRREPGARACRLVSGAWPAVESVEDSARRRCGSCNPRRRTRPGGRLASASAPMGLIAEIDSPISLAFRSRFGHQQAADWLSPKRFTAWLKATATEVRRPGRCCPPAWLDVIWRCWQDTSPTTRPATAPCNTCSAHRPRPVCPSPFPIPAPHAVAEELSTWSARSAARTNDTDSDEQHFQPRKLELGECGRPTVQTRTRLLL